jgi:hypothetical protein
MCDATCAAALYVVAAAGLPPDSPVPAVVAATLMAILPATLVLMSLGKAVGRAGALFTPRHFAQVKTRFNR